MRGRIEDTTFRSLTRRSRPGTLRVPRRRCRRCFAVVACGDRLALSRPGRFRRGGVARSYSLAYNAFFGKRAWAPSLPRNDRLHHFRRCSTTREPARVANFSIGRCAWPTGSARSRCRAGPCRGEHVNEPPSLAVFNTGAVIFGWVRAFKETGTEGYLQSAVRLGIFSLSCQDADGAWPTSLQV